VLISLGRPDIRIALDGEVCREPDNTHSYIRVVAGRSDLCAAVVTQLPGESFWYSGGYVVTECDVSALAATVLAELPAAQAGSTPNVVFPIRSAAEELDHSYWESDVRDAEDIAAQRYRAFACTPVSSFGTIDIEQGRSRFGPRGITRHQFGWRDLVGDGRYAILPGAQPVARPVDAAQLVHLVNDRIAQIEQAIQDERR
jgi:hypothetical protein